MKKHNLLSIILLCSVLLCYNCSKKSSNGGFSIDNRGLKPQYFLNEQVKFSFLNDENKKIDSIVFYVNDEKTIFEKKENSYVLDLKNSKFGSKSINAKVFADGETSPFDVFAKTEVVSDITPKLLKFEVVNIYNHDTTSFTEGLEFYKGVLLEGTGLNGKSKLLKTDYKTGKIDKKIDLDKQYFGEGITVINGKLFQITYTEQKGFIYNPDTFELEKTFAFDKKIEGWGMTNDGTNIYQSDGTEKIWTMNPENQKMISFVNVYSGKDKIKSVNELEWINGKIYANIWQKDAIAVVNPENGAVEGILNLLTLRKKLNYKNAEVLNGIAYKSDTKTIFITGKNWDKMFEIKITE
jgi:glutaminyl-peptide cyclotransferase